MKKKRINLEIFAFGALFSCFWGLYHSTLSPFFSYDSLTNALEIEYIGFKDVRSAGHVLPTLVGTLLFQCFEKVGHPLRALFIVQQFNVIMGALSVALFCAVLWPRFGWRLALVISSAFGLSFAYWSEVVDPGVYPLAGLCAVFGVFLILNQEKIPSWGAGIIAGIFLLVHEMFFFALPSLLFSQGFVKEGRSRRLTYFCLGLWVSGFIPFGALMLRHSTSGSEMVHWLLTPPGQRPLDSVLHHQFWSWSLGPNLFILWHSFVESIIGPKSNALVPLFRGYEILFQGLVVFGLIALFWKWFDERPLQFTRAEMGALTLWIIFTNLFQLFFAVGSVRYKVIFIPIVLTLLLGGLGVRHWRRFWLAALVLLLIGSVNTAWIWPRSHGGATNPDRVRCQWVSQTLTPHDFLIFTGELPMSITNVALRYFVPQVNARSIRGILFQDYGHLDFNSLEEEMNITWSHGGQVYMESDLFTSRDLQARLTGNDPRLAHWLQNYSPGKTRSGPDGYSLTTIFPIKKV